MQPTKPAVANATARMDFRVTENRRATSALALTFIAIFGFADPIAGRAAFAQPASPGPLNFLPFQEGFICEAWFDLQASTGIADWTGWQGSAWTSPHAYNSHQGTDFSVETGTPVYAAADGQVIAVTTNIPADTGSGYGNYVKIALTGKSPLGQDLDLITAHMLPTVVVSVGQSVVAGQLLGYSDNTGNSTSEHVHTELSIRGGSTLCPFYNALYRYPILFTPEGRTQVGHVIRIKTESTAIRADRFDSSAEIAKAHRGQLYFATCWQRGYYRILIPNNTGNRGGWVKALDATEVFEGTAIQALPDAGTYVHTATLAAPYPLRAAPDETSPTLGQIVFGGGRFVADQTSGGWYRIAIPGAEPRWGWVKPDARMVVWPQLTNPSVDVASVVAANQLPIRENFTEVGRSMFGRPKFIRSTVKTFSPATPGGDGKALFISNVEDNGDGECESVLVGRVDDRNYAVQADVYFNYKPTQGGWERYGIFLRDDGFAGIDDDFEGKGNCYAITWDSDDGRLRAARFVEAAVTDLLPAQRYEPASGWHTLRIEADEDQIRFLMDGALLLETTDTTFPSGPCGLIFSNHTTSAPADRGAYFDNFLAESLDPPTLSGPGWVMY